MTKKLCVPFYDIIRYRMTRRRPIGDIKMSETILCRFTFHSIFFGSSHLLKINDRHCIFGNLFDKHEHGL